MMRVGIRSIVAVACLAAAGAAGVRAAQAPGPGGGARATAPIRQIAYLKASNGDAADHFACGGVLDGHAGYGLAVSGDGNTMAVAAPHESSKSAGINGNQNDNSLYGAGAVYVFAKNPAGKWAQQAYVKASNPQMGAEFGHAVVLSADGNTMAVSAFWEASNATGVNGNQHDESIPQAGAVYVFTRQGTRWAQQAYIKASNTGEAGTADTFGDGDQFGVSVSISDDGSTLAVSSLTEDGGSPGINGNQADNSVNSAGAVYVFTRTGSTWAQQAYVKPTNPGGGDLFGYSVALSANGDTLAAGSYDEDGSSRGIDGDDDNQRNGAGAVYVFGRTNGVWAQQAYIHPHNAEAGDSFGVNVAISDDGNTLLAGSLDEDCMATGVNPPGCDNDRALDISTGAAYVFVRNGGVWSQQAYLKSSNTGPNDWFGSRLTLSGDGNTAVMGASLEDGNAKGINGPQDNNGAQEAGAAYLFTRSGTTWTQQAYIKSEQNEAFDEFGGSVALSRDGKTLVISAHGEDSSARGVNGNQRDNKRNESGAAYVFSLN
jgi:hypothetical protein